MILSRLANHILPEFSERTVPADAAVAFHCARVRAPDPRPERAAFVAASALMHGMTIVTANMADFELMGVMIANPRSNDH
ncbi:MAG: hypothetical protein P4L82_02005 [Ancalomicrobiaceae bacterium]|nr:hypothetical protein [Ancalomicrobiaceae bacterium]